MKKQAVLYGLALAVLILFLKTIEYRYLLRDLRTEVYVGLVAALFTALGIWAGTRLSAPKAAAALALESTAAAINPAIPLPEALPAAAPAPDLGISKRELEVLTLMAQGLTNQEIADQLFVSLNTVKKHTSSLFEKLDVKRRTQAIEKAKRLTIIA